MVKINISKKRPSMCQVSNLKKVRSQFGSSSKIYKELKKRCK